MQQYAATNVLREGYVNALKMIVKQSRVVRGMQIWRRTGCAKEVSRKTTSCFIHHSSGGARQIGLVSRMEPKHYQRKHFGPGRSSGVCTKGDLQWTVKTLYMTDGERLLSCGTQLGNTKHVADIVQK